MFEKKKIEITFLKAAKYLRLACKASDEPTIALQGLSLCAEVAELPDICTKLLTLTPSVNYTFYTRIIVISLLLFQW